MYPSDIEADSYRALAAAIVWRAVQDAFCNRKSRSKACRDQRSCDSCRREALAWLLSPAGLDMIYAAGLDGRVVQAKLYKFHAAGVRIWTHRGSGANATVKFTVRR